MSLGRGDENVTHEAEDPIHRRRAQHIWTEEDRHLLCILFRIYSNSPAELSLIFNNIKRNTLEDEGFSEKGMESNAVHTQWHHIRRGKTSPEVWQYTNLAYTLADARNEFHQVRKIVESVALEAKLELRLAVSERKAALQYFDCLEGQRSVRPQFSPGVLGGNVSRDSESSNEEAPRPRKKQRSSSPNSPDRGFHGRKLAQAHTSIAANSKIARPQLKQKRSWTNITGGIPTSMIAKQADPHHRVRRHPKLLWRAYWDGSQGSTVQGLRAGLFVDPQTPIPPPPQGVELERMAKNHLTPESISTGFISFSQNPLPTLHKAMKFPRNAHIVIVDFDKVQDANSRRFSSAKESIWLVPVLVSEYKFKLGKRGQFRGSGEWLIYGTVEESAIIASVSFDNLLGFARRTEGLANLLQLDRIAETQYAANLRAKLAPRLPEMNYDTGKNIGRLINFMQIDNAIHRELIAAQLAVSWGFIGANLVKGNAYETYMNGVFEVCESERGPTVEPDGENRNVMRELQIDNREIEVQPTGIPDMSANFCDTEKVSETEAENEEDDDDLINTQLQASANEAGVDIVCERLVVSHRKTLSISPHQGKGLRLSSAAPPIKHNSYTLRKSNNPKPLLLEAGIVEDGYLRWEPAHPPCNDSSKPHPAGDLRSYMVRTGVSKDGRINWEAANSRAGSPAPTVASSLDLFRKELLEAVEGFSPSPSLSVAAAMARARSVSTARSSTRSLVVGRGPPARSRSKDAQKPPPLVIVDLCEEDDGQNKERSAKASDTAKVKRVLGSGKSSRGLSKAPSTPFSKGWRSAVQKKAARYQSRVHRAEDDGVLKIVDCVDLTDGA